MTCDPDPPRQAGHLGGGVAHDLKNVFAVIAYNAELALLDAAVEGSPAHVCAVQILEACARGRELLAGGIASEADRGEPGAQPFEPATAPPPTLRSVNAEARGRPQTSTARILFVDDDQAILRVARRLLERLGHRVVTAVSGVEALDLVREEPGGFHLVLSDQTMPGLSGLELAERVRELAPAVPFVLCTGDTEAVPDEERRRLGICGVLEKPLRSARLAQALDFHLDQGEDRWRKS